MPTYTVKDPTTGRTVDIKGDKPPTELELQQIFKVINTRPETPSAPAGKPQVAPSITDVTNLVGNVGTGGAMGATETAGWLGRQVSNIPSLGPAFTNIGNQLGGLYSRLRYGSEAVPEPVTYAQGEAALRQETQPQNTAQAVGKGLERAGEYYLTGAAAGGATALPQAGRLTRMAVQAPTQAAAAGGTAVAHGESPTVPAVLGAAGPVVGAGVGAAGDVIKGRAIPFVRAGLKAPISILQQQPGFSRKGLDISADELAEFIVKNRLMNREQADAVVKKMEAEVSRIVAANKDLPTDTPSRIMLYLDTFEKEAAKAFNPEHAAAIRRVAETLLESPTSGVGQTVLTTSMQPHPKLVTPSGQPMMVPTQTPTRTLRPSMPVGEAWERARASGRFQTSGEWGQLQDTAEEAYKQAERATRDSMKDVIPEVRTPLQHEGKAILTRLVMDRMQWRQGNLETVGLPTLAGGIIQPVIGIAVQALRKNQVRAGIWADKLGNAIKNNDVATAAAILNKFGISLTEQGSDVSLPAEGAEAQPTEAR